MTGLTTAPTTGTPHAPAFERVSGVRWRWRAIEPQTGCDVVVEVHKRPHRLPSERYAVRLYVDGGEDARRASTVETRPQARLRALSLLLGECARLRARARLGKRRPFDGRRSPLAYYQDTTPAAPVAGFVRLCRERRCVICGARNIGNCGQGEACPFWAPRIPRGGGTTSS